MKVLYTLIFLLSLISNAFSQKVSVKKGKVLFDNIAVATVKVKGRDYTYASIDNDTNKVIATLFDKEVSRDETESWLVISDPKTEKSLEVKMEWFTISMNFKKGIAELLAKKYEIITDNGIENLNSFFNKGNIELEENITANKVHENEIIKGRETYEVDSEGIINSKNGKRVATINFLDGGSYNVLDYEGKEIAKIMDFNNRDFKITLFDVKVENIELALRGAQSLNSRVLEFLIKSGYSDVLENGTTPRRQKRIEEYEKRKKNTVNIIGKRGYVIDKNGKRYTGGITLKFENIKDPRLEEKSLGIRSEGGTYVKVDYIDEEGSERQGIFRAKNLSVYVINEDDSKRVFKGFRNETKQKPLSSDSKLDDIFGNYFFQEIKYESGKIILFQNPIKQKEYGIKVENQEKSHYFNLKSKERGIKNINSYFGCTVPSEFVKLDFSKESDIKRLITYYENQCKK